MKKLLAASLLALATSQAQAIDCNKVIQIVDSLSISSSNCVAYHEALTCLDHVNVWDTLVTNQNAMYALSYCASQYPSIVTKFKTVERRNKIISFRMYGK
jgi:hypothetical protein